MRDGTLILAITRQIGFNALTAFEIIAMQISAFTSGLASLHSGQQRVDRAASEIAANSLSRAEVAAVAPNEADLASQLIELERSKLEAQAGAKLVKTADEVLGTLIDTHA
ncbi:hypothetical protein [Zestomonas carbonaria]|uniref:hypothetical protein n=1 Tax=Zestomonas carbonaria TaxID=2762745 RepID=UPI001F22AE18|nr:hypothetical protein [Pseudomonas carbonaria]